MPKISKKEKARRKELKKALKTGKNNRTFPKLIDVTGDERVYLDQDNHFYITADAPQRLP